MATQLSFDDLWSSTAEPKPRRKLLVTGASGFIGGFLVEKALQEGFDVWAGIRGTSSRKWLQDERIHFIELTYGDVATLRAQLQAFAADEGRWDVIIHCAGVTKCLDPNDFNRINLIGSRNFVDTLVNLSLVPRQFIFMSSLGAYGPVHEAEPHVPITDADEPRPNTRYGISKLHVEDHLKNIGDFPYVIFRPTGVYGPREKDYFLMVEGISKGIDVALGRKPQDITFIYVKDLVKAVFLAIDKGVTQRAYFVSDGDVHTSRDFSDLICRELPKERVLRIVAPLWLGRAAAGACELWSRIAKKPVTLNKDKYNILRQRNWICDIQPLRDELGFSPDYNLERGVAETIRWYKEEHWI